VFFFDADFYIHPIKHKRPLLKETIPWNEHFKILHYLPLICYLNWKDNAFAKKIGTFWGGTSTKVVLVVTCDIYTHDRGCIHVLSEHIQSQIRIYLQHDKKGNALGSYGHVHDFNYIMCNNHKG